VGGGHYPGLFLFASAPEKVGAGRSVDLVSTFFMGFSRCEPDVTAA